MRIFQAMPTLSRGDAVGNHALSLMELISRMGYETAVYASNIADNIPKNMQRRIEKLPKLNRGDVLIYHQSIGTHIAERIAALPCRKILVYHNVTPSRFFSGYSSEMMRRTELGLNNTRMLLGTVDAVWADSEFNRREIRNMGYSGEVEVLPILIPFADYEKNPDEAVLGRLGDGLRNILFVGRVAPNKKQEDILAAFSYYQKNINARARLSLVGSYESNDAYAMRLKAYMHKLGLVDAAITGHVRFEEMLAYYRTADAFVCLSEHEGFCVPLLEAIFFDVPVIAYNAAAVADTLGGSGVLLEQKDPVFVASVIERVLNDKTLREGIVQTQRERLLDFAYDRVAAQYSAAIQEFLEKCI